MGDKRVYTRGDNDSGGRVIRPCSRCRTRQATDRHHRFPQHKANVKHYGRKLIDHPANIIWMCSACHASHADVSGLTWGEAEFRAEMIGRGYELPEPMRSFKA